MNNKTNIPNNIVALGWGEYDDYRETVYHVLKPFTIEDAYKQFISEWDDVGYYTSHQRLFEHWLINNQYISRKYLHYVDLDAVVSTNGVGRTDLFTPHDTTVD